MERDEIIEMYVEPLKSEECRRLDVPEDFISSVRLCRRKHTSGFCDPVLDKSGKLIAVRIGIDEGEKPRGARSVFIR